MDTFDFFKDELNNIDAHDLRISNPDKTPIDPSLLNIGKKQSSGTFN